MAAISIEVGVDGLDMLLARMEGAPALIEREAKSAIEDSTFYVEAAVKDLTPVNTGYLRTSIHSQSSAYFGEVQGRVSTNVNYAPFVEEGHGEIRPRRARALRFRPKGSAGFVYARRVRPVAGIHMFRQGLEIARPAIVERFKLAMQLVAKAIAA